MTDETAVAAAPSADELMEANHVTVTFGKGAYAFTAVDDVSVRIRRGEVVGIVGESGSGKTTLALAIAGLQPIAAGRVQFFGDSDVQRRQRRTGVQMVFQDPYSSLNPRQTPRAAVTEAIQVCQHLNKAKSDVKAKDLLQSIGISGDLIDRMPAQLSGGQRQRVSMARALAAEPNLLIADEPTSALDQSAQAQLLNLLHKIQAERHLAVLFISHDLSIIRYFTERVYVMRHGVVTEHGETQQVFRNPTSPYTRLLVESIPGRRIPTDRQS